MDGSLDVEVAASFLLTAMARIDDRMETNDSIPNRISWN